MFGLLVEVLHERAHFGAWRVDLSNVRPLRKFCQYHGLAITTVTSPKNTLPLLARSNRRGHGECANGDQYIGSCMPFSKWQVVHSMAPARHLASHTLPLGVICTRRNARQTDG